MKRKKRHNTHLAPQKLPLSEAHLKTMRGLTQFSRCWSVIDSHLAVYRLLHDAIDQYERLSNGMADSVEHRHGLNERTKAKGE